MSQVNPYAGLPSSIARSMVVARLPNELPPDVPRNPSKAANQAGSKDQPKVIE